MRAAGFQLWLKGKKKRLNSGFNHCKLFECVHICHIRVLKLGLKIIVLGHEKIIVG